MCSLIRLRFAVSVLDGGSVSLGQGSRVGRSGDDCRWHAPGFDRRRRRLIQGNTVCPPRPSDRSAGARRSRSSNGPGSDLQLPSVPHAQAKNHLGGANAYSEDCLTTNVWTEPSRSHKRLPVMVWIYGGGLSSAPPPHPFTMARGSSARTSLWSALTIARAGSASPPTRRSTPVPVASRSVITA